MTDHYREDEVHHTAVPLVPRQQDGKQVLVLDVGQQVYTFVPAK